MTGRPKSLSITRDAVRALNRVTVNSRRIGAALRRARLAAGMTQVDAQVASGIRRPIIARAESGRHHLQSLDTLERLASAYGVTMQSLFVVSESDLAEVASAACDESKSAQAEE